MSHPQNRRSLRNIRIAAVLLVMALLVVAQRLGIFQQFADPARVRQTLVELGPRGYLAFVAAYAVLQPFGMPGTVFIMAAPLIWPWPVAFALSMAGTMAASIVGFSFARFIARDWIATKIPARFRRYDDALARRAFATVFLLRLVFWMPPLLHAFFGVSRVPFATHVWGSLLGYVAPLLLVSYFGPRVFIALKEAPVDLWIGLGIGVMVLGLGVWLVRRRRLAAGQVRPVMLLLGLATLPGAEALAHAALAPAQQVLWDQAAVRSQAVAAALDGVLSYAILDLRTGLRVHLRGDLPLPAASVIKLPLLYGLLRQADAGRLTLSAPVPLRRAAQLGDEGLLSQFDDGTSTLSLGDLAAAMIVLSENSATNLLLDRVGMDAVNAEARALGLRHTVLRRRMLDLPAARAGRENLTTANDIVTLLARIYGAPAPVVLAAAGPARPGAPPPLSVAARERFLRLLRVPDKPGGLLSRRLPPGVVVANKPGALDGARHDCGLLDLGLPAPSGPPTSPFAICVLTTLLRDEAAGEAAVADLAEIWYHALRRIARSSPNGRLLPPP